MLDLLNVLDKALLTMPLERGVKHQRWPHLDINVEVVCPFLRVHVKDVYDLDFLLVSLC